MGRLSLFMAYSSRTMNPQLEQNPGWEEAENDK